MKKIVSLFIVLLVGLVLVGAGCGGKEAGVVEPEKKEVGGELEKIEEEAGEIPLAVEEKTEEEKEKEVPKVEEKKKEEVSPTPKSVTITGVVADCRYPYGTLVGIPNATVSYAAISSTTDQEGHFVLPVPSGQQLFLDITAPGYMSYREQSSRMVEGAFHLIPKDLYRGMYLVLWNRERSNPQNWHRKWEKQTEFVVVRTGASEQQINAVLSILATDEYRKMTGGRFTSAVKPTIVDSKPTGNDREGKTVISFAPGIIRGGIAHSEDRNGIIYYAEITWDVNQVVDSVIFWHEMFHTVSAGGHINEWPSVVSEMQTTGYVTKTDEEILNCIYNSPPRRGNDQAAS